MVLHLLLSQDFGTESRNRWKVPIRNRVTWRHQKKKVRLHRNMWRDLWKVIV